jgi:stress-induced morphogen
MTTDQVKELIEAGLPGAAIEVTDERSTGDHFSAVIEWAGFEGLSLLEQHQAVYTAVGEHLTKEIHALQLKTFPPNTD